jgi:hypothetical protein
MMSSVTSSAVVRTQVYLTKEQHAALHRAAERSGVSMTEELRRLIDRHLLAKGVDPVLTREAYFCFVGVGESGLHDVAERHDDYLSGALRGANLR